MKNYGIAYKHRITGIIARETGVDFTGWLIIEADHLNFKGNREPNSLTIPYFIINNLDWEEIKTPYENGEYRIFCHTALMNNSNIFQKDKELYFLPKIL